MEAVEYPLSNMQLELLKLFSRDIKEEDLIEIKRLIVRYLADRLAEKADEVWDEQSWSDEKMEELLNTHMRTKYE